MEHTLLVSVVPASIEHMFDTSWLDDLDATAACEAVIVNQDDLREQEWRELAIAARWAVLHGPESLPAQDPAPGRERLVRRGGDGTPEIAEFGCAELGLLTGVGFIAASNLLRDALDLQHRHPLMWAALADGKGRVWKARQVAKLVHAARLSREQAWFVDAATTGYVDTLTWSAFTRLVEAKIIEADPAAAEARRAAAALERFVATGATNEHGLKTLVARAHAGDVIYFVAMCDRIAQILLLEGDDDPVDVRRSKAIAILANPAAALLMLERHASTEPHRDDPDRSPVPVDPRVSGTAALPANACQRCGGPRVDPEKLRPRAVLYVRVSEQALRGHGGAHGGSGIGSVTVQAVADLLGHHRVAVRPVIDLRGNVPVDAYEVPHEMQEALRLARPSSTFPWSRAGSGTPDWDHTRAYVPPEAGGSPGQTRVGNLGPMVRFGHRVKTFGRGWQLRQPRPGVYLWRTRHGYWFRVDQDGTHPLGRDPDLSVYDPPAAHSQLEHAVVELLASV